MCFVLPSHVSASSGGSELQADMLAREMTLRGHSVVYVTKRVAQLRSEDYEVICVDRGARRLSDVPAVLAALSRLKPTLIYQRVGSAYTGACALYARFKRVPMIWHVASEMDLETPSIRWSQPVRWLENRLLRYAIRNVPIIVCQTTNQRKMLQANYGRSADFVIGNFHTVPDVRDQWPSVKRVIWIGNLKPVKQPHHFMRLAKALAGVSDAEFVMVGRAYADGRKQAQLEAEIACIPNLSYRGEVSHDEVNQLLEDSALLVNTSATEGFSNTFIQAWMRRVPVASLSVDPDGVFSKLGLGFCASGDFAALQRGVLSLLDDDTRRKEIGVRSREAAIQSYSEQNKNLLADTMETVLSGGSSS